MVTSRRSSSQSTGDGTKAKKAKAQMSAKTQAQYALNDLLTLHEDDKGTPEVVAARKVLSDAGFEPRPSRAQEIEKIKTEMQSVDASEPGAAATLIELGKRLSAAQRGKIQAAKKAKS